MSQYTYLILDLIRDLFFLFEKKNNLRIELSSILGLFGLDFVKNDSLVIHLSLERLIFILNLKKK